MARRNKPELLEQVSQAVALEGRVRDLQSQRDALRAEVNELSKQVGLKRREGDAAGAEALQASSRELGERERQLAVDADEASAALRDLLLRIPNLPHPQAARACRWR